MKPSNFHSCNFESVIGHEKQCAHLKDLLRDNSVPHALIFSGTKSVGKLRVAKSFAAELLTCKASTTAAISVDGLKKLFATGNHPDYHFLEREEGKKDISVEQIRDLISKLSLKPYYGNFVVAIINDAHLMSVAACNALLKTLEEPTSGTFLFLVTESPQKLLETVLSRCQNIKFSELSKKEVEEVLEQICNEAVIGDLNLNKFAEFCSGSLSCLKFNEFIDPRTSCINNQDGLREHMSFVLERAEKLTANFSKLLSSASKTNYPLILASQLMEEDELDELVWSCMFTAIRNKMHSGGDEARLGELLIEAAQTYGTIYERNANKDLAMSNLLLKCAGIN